MEDARVSSVAAAASDSATASQARERAGLVLGTLILVAAVANLNLSVANVALPDIGAAFDASQTQLNLVAVGFSLGLAASVLFAMGAGGPGEGHVADQLIADFGDRIDAETIRLVARARARLVRSCDGADVRAHHRLAIGACAARGVAHRPTARGSGLRTATMKAVARQEMSAGGRG